jgi:hypothetical protein
MSPSGDCNARNSHSPDQKPKVLSARSAHGSQEREASDVFVMIDEAQ